MHKNTFDHSNTTVLAIYSPLRAPTRATFLRGPQVTPKLLRTSLSLSQPSWQPIGRTSDCPMHHHPSAHLSSCSDKCCPHGGAAQSRPAIRSGDAPLAARLVPMPVKRVGSSQALLTTTTTTRSQVCLIALPLGRGSATNPECIRHPACTTSRLARLRSSRTTTTHVASTSLLR